MDGLHFANVGACSEDKMTLAIGIFSWIASNSQKIIRFLLLGHF